MSGQGGLLGSVFGGIVSGVGSLSETQAERQAAEYQARVAGNQRELALSTSRGRAADIRRRGRFLLGQQRAATAHAGVTEEGSPLQVMADSAAEVELDAQRALWAGQVEATGFADIAAMRRFEARKAKSEMFNRAGAAFLGGAQRGGGSTLLTNPYTFRGSRFGSQYGASGSPGYYYE